MLHPVIIPQVVGVWREHRPVPLRPPPSIQTLVEAGLQDVLSALSEVSHQLSEAGIRHVVVGGLAIGVYGWPRATREVDLLLGMEVFGRLPSGELEPRVALPEIVEGIPINYMYIDVAGKFLDLALDAPLFSNGIPFAPPEVLVCTKLLRLAMRDQADIVQILKAKLVDRKRIRAFLGARQPPLLGPFDALVSQADAESERESRGSCACGF